MWNVKEDYHTVEVTINQLFIFTFSTAWMLYINTLRILQPLEYIICIYVLDIKFTILLQYLKKDTNWLWVKPAGYLFCHWDVICTALIQTCVPYFQPRTGLAFVSWRSWICLITAWPVCLWPSCTVWNPWAPSMCAGTNWEASLTPGPVHW